MKLREVIQKPRALALAVTIGGLALLPLAAPTAAQSHYAVRYGDTLTAISEAYGVSIDAIVELNGLDNPDLIFPGQELIIPGGNELREPEQESEPEPVHTGVGGGIPTYIVQAGDTLSGIAGAFGVTVDALVDANQIANPHLIVTGQVLVLPASSAPPAQPAASAPARLSHEEIRSMIYDAAIIHREDPYLMMALAWRESGWQQNVVSSAGAVGIMQLMPSTAAWAGPALVGREIDPVHSAWDNIETGVAFYAHLYSLVKDDYYALAGYYQGPYSVEVHGLFPDTEDYVENILEMRDLFAAGRLP